MTLVDSKWETTLVSDSLNTSEDQDGNYNACAEGDPTTPNEPATTDLEPAVASETRNGNESSTLPPYLKHNDWEKELNFKLWVTKGARFVASSRCTRQHYWSRLSLNILTASLIVLGLFPFFLHSITKTVSWESLSLAITGLSVLALVWGQHESAEQYELKAHRFHRCALAVGKLYSRLRQSKHLPNDEKTGVLQRISNEYEDLLSRFENHEPLDYNLFRLQKPDYFKVRCFEKLKVKFKAFIFTRAVYFGIMLVPVLGVFWIIQQITSG
ncbi:SLATT domain-containing protein [Haloferula sp. A504]|uniref:SLATT domain-containing protein n=1 Tax=Haloferula sp. A504 TaxID=3373601 RepID=UPI0031BC5593|nr:SLATT domain-containing protein [Verrucomicrobiaceae bacterium E54]